MEKKLRLMRYWLLGAYIIIFVGFTVYLLSGLGMGAMLLGEISYWLVMLIVAVLFVVVYYGYKWYLNQQA